MSGELIYFDNSATTKVDPRVVDAMLPYFTEKYGNPSSIHAAGQPVHKDLAKFRETVATFLNAEPQEILFVASGSEADNFALLQGTELSGKKHIITTAIEHKAILNTVEHMRTKGYEVTYLPVDSNGVISIKDLENAIRPDTALISIMMANNETGSIQPVVEAGALAKRHGVLFHIDAVQAAGKIRIDAQELNADFITVSGHKIYAPKGIAILYIRKDIRNKLTPLIHGGSQEEGLRAGTENIPYIAGIAKAVEIITEDGFKEAEKLRLLRDTFEKRILSEIPHTNVNGNTDLRVPTVTNITFKYIEAEAVIGYVPKICCSLGSACSAREDAASHVLTAMGINIVDIRGSIRFSFGRFNTMDEVNAAVEMLKTGIGKLRAMSPIYKG